VQASVLADAEAVGSLERLEDLAEKTKEG